MRERFRWRRDWRIGCLKVGVSIDPHLWLVAGIMGRGVLLGALGFAVLVERR